MIEKGKEKEEKKAKAVKKKKPAEAAPAPAIAKPKAVRKPKEKPAAPPVEAVEVKPAVPAEPVIQAPPVIHAEPKIVKEKKPPKKKKSLGPVKYHGVGRRKTAVARVWLIPGQGKISINHRPLMEYMNNRPVLETKVYLPLEVTHSRSSYDVVASICGGGVPAQADALRMGIARALLAVNPDFKPTLSKAGLLSRDPREKERKKYGHKRARKSFQYSKR